MKNIVTIGGGTGSFVLLNGLKKYPVNISAIVSMADDGGSTGVLRDELGVLPPGDVRQCLVALSHSSEKLRELMNYRFDHGQLKGHNFGNLFLSALEKIEGNFAKGVAEATKILNVKGEIIPVTEQKVELYLKLKNGKLLKGEHEINHNFSIEKIGMEKIYLKPKASANQQAVRKIREADMIVIGPGNHYCSIIPNLLFPEIVRAINQSKAKVVYNCNLVNKKGHTEKFFLENYVNAINRFLGQDRVDFVTFNSVKPSKWLIKKYLKQGETLIQMKEERAERGYRVIRGELLGEMVKNIRSGDNLYAERSFIRHDSDRLAKMLMMIMELGEYENIIKSIV